MLKTFSNMTENELKRYEKELLEELAKVRKRLNDLRRARRLVDPEEKNKAPT